MKYLVVDFKFKGMVGKRGLMFVSYYGKSREFFISNYKSWHEYHTQGRIVEIATSLISHETLHLTINKFSLTASAKLDNLFGRSNSWEHYTHGLGDFDNQNPNNRLTLNRTQKFGNVKIKRQRR